MEKRERSRWMGEKHAWENGEKKGKRNWLCLSKRLVCVLVWVTLVWHIPEKSTSDYFVGRLTTQPLCARVQGIHQWSSPCADGVLGPRDSGCPWHGA